MESRCRYHRVGTGQSLLNSSLEVRHSSAGEAQEKDVLWIYLGALEQPERPANQEFGLPRARSADNQLGACGPGHGRFPAVRVDSVLGGHEQSVGEALGGLGRMARGRIDTVRAIGRWALIYQFDGESGQCEQL